jgi:hypothetical protein
VLSLFRSLSAAVRDISHALPNPGGSKRSGVCTGDNPLNLLKQGIAAAAQRRVISPRCIGGDGILGTTVVLRRVIPNFMSAV